MRNRTYMDGSDVAPPTKEEVVDPAQNDLFKAHARRFDPRTSHDAARSLSPGKLRDSQRAVLSHFVKFGPMTDTDLVNIYVGSPQSRSGLRTRRKELTDRGLIEDTGARKKLPTGRNAIIWRATLQPPQRND
tara:strand:+ start:96 stop:491 length:396 start_codon:yes stop_codon:yes gene_type:complete